MVTKRRLSVVGLTCLLVVVGAGKHWNSRSAGSASAVQNKLTEPQGWALGCSAILIERNHGRHDLLGTDLRTPRKMEKMRALKNTERFWKDTQAMSRDCKR
jgi:hypothetical protein